MLEGLEMQDHYLSATIGENHSPEHEEPADQWKQGKMQKKSEITNIKLFDSSNFTCNGNLTYQQ